MPERKLSFLKKSFGRGNAFWGFAEGLATGDSVTITRIVWGRIVLGVVMVLLLGWVGLGTAFYLFQTQVRGFKTITWAQCVLPWQWAERRVVQGNEIIELAKAAMREQKAREAFFLLRTGVGLAPRNVEGRILLAQFQTAMGRQDLAIDLLASGMKGNEDNVDYLRAVFQILLQFQEDEKVRSLAEGLLPNPPVVTPRTQLIALAAATAMFHRGNYDQAEDLVITYDLLRTREGWPLMAKIDWERGYRDLAVRRLEELTERLPSEDTLYVMLGQFYREMGREAKAESTALLRQLVNPASPSPRIGLLYAYHEKNDEARLETTIDRYFREFGTNREALWQLADFAANTGRVALAQRVIEYCTKSNLPKDGPILMSIEAAIVAREYRRGLDLLDGLEKENPRWVSNFGAVISGLQAIASIGVGNVEAGDAYLTRFLSQPNIRVESLMAVSTRLQELGAQERARRVLAQAAKVDIFNQAALSRLIEIDLELGNTLELSRNLSRLIGLRKPSIDLMESARARLSSDFFAFLDDRDAIVARIETAIRDRRATTGQSGGDTRNPAG